MLTIPSVPIEADRGALEDRSEVKSDYGTNDQNNCTPNKLPDGLPWENTQVERQERELDDKDFTKINDFVYILELCVAISIKGAR